MLYCSLFLFFNSLSLTFSLSLLLSLSLFLSFSTTTRSHSTYHSSAVAAKKLLNLFWLKNKIIKRPRTRLPDFQIKKLPVFCAFFVLKMFLMSCLNRRRSMSKVEAGGKFWWEQPLFRLCLSFQTNITILTTNKCEKYPSSIWRRDSNSQPSDYKSPPLTTRPGLPSQKDILLIEGQWDLIGRFRKFSVANFITKVAQKSDDLLGYFDKCHI